MSREVYFIVSSVILMFTINITSQELWNIPTQTGIIPLQEMENIYWEYPFYNNYYWDFYTDQKPIVGTSVVLKIKSDPYYDCQHYFFELYDSSNLVIFRVRVGHQKVNYKRQLYIHEDSQINDADGGHWMSTSGRDIHITKYMYISTYEIAIVIGSEFYELKLDGKTLKESRFKINWNRLLDFEYYGLSVNSKNTHDCLDLDSSYVYRSSDIEICSPLKLDHGSISPAGYIPEGVAVTQSCDVGYKLSGEWLATCENGTYYTNVSPCVPFKGEHRQTFSEFDFVSKSNMYLSTKELHISSIFYANLIFNGLYEEGCRLSFNIVDEEIMFHLDFRFNFGNAYRQVIQNSILNNRWGYIYEESRTNLPDFRLQNDVFILVTSKYYEVTVNGIAIEPRFPVDLDRLYDYRGIQFGVQGSCATIDMKKSYLADGGGYSFDLVDRTGTKIQLGKSSGLLVVKRSGYSKEGTVCGHKFSNDAAKRLCQELGFHNFEDWNINLEWEIQNAYKVMIYEVSCEEESCIYNSVPDDDEIYTICDGSTNVFLSCQSNEDACEVQDYNQFMKIVCTDSKGNDYFKCLNSDVYYSIEAALPGYSKVSSLCENDPHFYQVCGAGHNEVLTTGGTDLGLLCGYYICQDGNGIYTSSYTADYTYSCNRKHECVNTQLDEADCAERDQMETPLVLTTPNSQLCNGVCNLKDCEDEAYCNGLRYGAMYKSQYYPPFLVYPGDIGLEKGESYTYCESFLNTNQMYPIFNFTRCAPFEFTPRAMDEGKRVTRERNPYCRNYLDQTNCTDNSRVAMSCIVQGYPATIAKQMLCHGLEGVKICSDGLENVCYDLSTSCRVHKHLMCDGVDDCLDKSDELDLICRNLTPRRCTRRVGHHKLLSFPLAWLQDNVIDCQDKKDEVGDWPSCGTGPTLRFVTDNSSCTEDFICLHGNAKFIHSEELCDRIETCGNENGICKVSARLLDLWTMTPVGLNGEKHLFHCLKGLSQLQNLNARCEHIGFRHNKEDLFGLSKETDRLYLPLKTYDCRHMYGELYVYTACLEHCESPAICPLTTRVRYDSCSGQYPNRVFTVQNHQNLVFLLRSRGKYHSDVFVCNNNKCIEYSKVCDLVNDCGDNSDESICINHFECHDSHNYIAWTQVCDGVIDCRDMSDECNSQCGKEIISGLTLKIFAWLIGILAVLFNSWIVISNLKSLGKSRATMVVINKILILLISLGDFIVGVYLILISYIDAKQGSDHCHIQSDWITNWRCSFFGVMSTFGSQISLFSMTVLSFARFSGIRSAMSVGNNINKKSAGLIVLLVLSIVLAAFSVATIPLLDAMEDFFVNGIYHDKTIPLFVGLPDKETHTKIIEEYYGNIDTRRKIPWNIIFGMVQSMFTANYGGIRFKKVDFYGNDPVCLFKYFVHNDDPQKIYVWMALILNFICFLIISTLYIVITIISVGTSSALVRGGQNQMVLERNRRMQRKISLIILTDFCCWVPFILIAGLHTLNKVDASQWYALLSIIALPINSVINPLLYDDSIGKCFQKIHSNMPTVNSFRQSMKSRVGHS